MNLIFIFYLKRFIRRLICLCPSHHFIRYVFFPYKNPSISEILTYATNCYVTHGLLVSIDKLKKFATEGSKFFNSLEWIIRFIHFKPKNFDSSLTGFTFRWTYFSLLKMKLSKLFTQDCHIEFLFSNNPVLFLYRLSGPKISYLKFLVAKLFVLEKT